MNKIIYLYAIHPSKTYAIAVIPYANVSGKTRPFAYHTASHAAKSLGVSQHCVSQACDTDRSVRGCMVRSEDLGLSINGDFSGTKTRYALYDANGNRIHMRDNTGVMYSNGSDEPMINTGLSLILGNTLNEIRTLFPPSHPSLRMLQMLTSDKLTYRTLSTNRGYNQGVLLYEYKKLFVTPVIPWLIKNTVNTAVEHLSTCVVHGSVVTDNAPPEFKYLATNLNVKLTCRKFVRSAVNRYGRTCIECKQKTFSLDGLAASLYYQYSLRNIGIKYDDIIEQLTKKMVDTYILNIGSGAYRPVLDDTGKLSQKGHIRILLDVYESIGHYVATTYRADTLTVCIGKYNAVMDTLILDYTDDPVTTHPTGAQIKDMTGVILTTM